MALGIWSLLPLLATLLAGPLIVRAAPRGAPRRVAAGFVGALLLAHAGLYALEWSVTACWLLVALASTALAFAALPRSRVAPLAALGGSLALGLLFESAPFDLGVLVYLAGAFPLLLGIPAALAASSWLRWAPGREGAAASALAVAAFTVVPLTSFFPTFLLAFEPVHLPLTLGALGAVAFASRRFAPAPPIAASVGEYLARAETTARGVLPRAAAALAMAGAALAWSRAPPDLALVGIAGALALLAVLPRLGVVAPVAALLAAALLGPQAALDLHLRAGGASAVAGLALAALAGTLGAIGLAQEASRRRERHAREELAGTRRGVVASAASLREGLPRALVREGDAATVGALEALAREASAAGDVLAVLVVRAPLRDPFWSLPEDAYAWLAAREASPRVHVAIVEGAEATFVPPVLPEEVEA